MWDAEIRAQAALVTGVGDDVSRVASEVARCGDVEFRSRAADLLRARLDDLVGELLAGRQACDEAAAALREHASAVARWVVDTASTVRGRW